MSGRRISAGGVVLTVIVLFVVATLARERRLLADRERGIEAALAPLRLQPPDTPGMSRFRSDMWYLPDEPLLGFVEIPDGEFVMGSDPGRDRMAYENERWSAASFQGVLRLPTYYLGRYEVTVAQFGAFVMDSRRVKSAALVARRWGAPDSPMAEITWSEAVEYARWLEDKLRREGSGSRTLDALISAGWRILLPSEAEWEKGARGESGRIFPWGDDPLTPRGNLASGGVAPVGSFECSGCAWGLADMSGNVWEMTRSPMRPYPWGGDVALRSGREDALFVMRGGGFADGLNNARGGVRGGFDPGVRKDFIGFRLALIPPGLLEYTPVTP